MIFLFNLIILYQIKLLEYEIDDYNNNILLRLNRNKNKIDIKSHQHINDELKYILKTNVKYDEEETIFMKMVSLCYMLFPFFFLSV